MEQRVYPLLEALDRDGVDDAMGALGVRLVNVVETEAGAQVLAMTADRTARITFVRGPGAGASGDAFTHVVVEGFGIDALSARLRELLGVAS